MIKRARHLSLATTAVLTAVVLAGTMFTVAAVRRSPREQPPVFSSSRMLLELWNAYKKNNLEQSTLRTLDKQQNNITTSQSQAYTMMRAVWMDDQATFERSWQWTKDNLQQANYSMASRFGQLESGRYGVIDTTGHADADTDIAYALLMGSSRWKEPRYLWDARPIVDAIWQNYAVNVRGRPVLLATTAPADRRANLVNVSYLSPYAYRIFANVRPQRNWTGLLDNSYDMLATAGTATINGRRGSGVTPDWLSINRQTGTWGASPNAAQTTAFNGTAMRTVWKMALEWHWHREARALRVLAGYTRTLNAQGGQLPKLAAAYDHQGRVSNAGPTPATYGLLMGYYVVRSPEAARMLYEEKLRPLYDADKQSWKSPLSYWDDTWVWFGVALQSNNITNLTPYYE